MAGGKIQIQSSAAVLGSSLSRGRFIVCFALVCSLFFLWGLSYGLIDSLNKHFQNLFGITIAESTGLQDMYFGSYLVMSIPASLFMNRFGYKAVVIGGLSLFSLGAIMFWPCAVAETYAGFLVCTFIVGSGLATLEVAANSYICVLAGQKHASMALTFAQGFNGISGFAGPLIASKAFFTGENLTSFGGVQWTYLAIGCFGIFLIVLFVVVKFPEVRQDTLPEDDEFLKANGYRGLFRRKRLVFGFFAASRCGVVRAGRFISLPLLHFFYPPAILGIYGAGCFLFAMLTSQVAGNGGMACLFLLFWFESVCYPVIFSQATMGLGPYAKAGSAIIAMGKYAWLEEPGIRRFRLQTNGFHFRALRVEEDATLHAGMAAVEVSSEKKDGMDHYEDKVGVRPFELDVDPSVASDVQKKMA
ncbi:hypothetical protein RQP46_010911 [Phenoliferia psychrophenolica]